MPQAILVSGWSISKKSSSLKPFGQIKQHFTGNIYGRSSIRFFHLILIGQKTWYPWAILVSDWLKLKKIFSSETGKHNELLLCMGDPDKIAIFRADHKTNMAAIGSCGL